MRSANLFNWLLYSINQSSYKYIGIFLRYILTLKLWLLLIDIYQGIGFTMLTCDLATRWPHPLPLPVLQEHRDAPTAGTLQGGPALLGPLRHPRRQPGRRGGTQEATRQVAGAGVVGATLPDLPAPLLPVHGEAPEGRWGGSGAAASNSNAQWGQNLRPGQGQCWYLMDKKFFHPIEEWIFSDGTKLVSLEPDYQSKAEYFEINVAHMQNPTVMN